MVKKMVKKLYNGHACQARDKISIIFIFFKLKSYSVGMNFM